MGCQNHQWRSSRLRRLSLASRILRGRQKRKVDGDPMIRPSEGADERRRGRRVGLLLPLFLSSALWATPDLSKGIAAFEDRRWSEAMDAFLEALRQEPTNIEAHAYINLIAR